ncbi:hypothetical protein ACLB2K_051669 [Fragaria x ananassa]
MTGNGGEAVVVCSDKSMGTGITVWDIDTRDRLLHIPSCASPPRGLLCLRNQFIVASQIHRPGSVGGGVITMWPLNKPQQPLWSYPMEAIVSLACTKDGVYLAGGAPSGNAYLWEWKIAQNLACTLLLDVEDYQSFPSLLNYSIDHKSSITGLSTTSGSSRVVLLSRSLDGSCKVWDLSLGTLLHTQVYPISITALVLSPTEQLFFSGGIDGRIFVNQLEIGLVDDDTLLVVEDQAVVLKGHKFDHQKGPVTNLAVIPRSSLLPGSNQRRGFGLSILKKYPQPANSSRRDMSITLASPCQVLKEDHNLINCQTTDTHQHIYDMEKEHTPASMEMKLERSLEERMWATRMANHVMDMNRHLQSRLLDLMQSNFLLSRSTEMDSPPRKKRKTTLMSENPPLQEVEQS